MPFAISRHIATRRKRWGAAAARYMNRGSRRRSRSRNGSAYSPRHRMTERSRSPGHVAPPPSAASAPEKTKTPPRAAALQNRVYFAGLAAAMFASLVALFLSPRDTPPPDDP